MLSSLKVGHLHSNEKVKQLGANLMNNSFGKFSSVNYRVMLLLHEHFVANR